MQSPKILAQIFEIINNQVSQEPTATIFYPYEIEKVQKSIDLQIEFLDNYINLERKRLKASNHRLCPLDQEYAKNWMERNTYSFQRNNGHGINFCIELINNYLRNFLLIEGVKVNSKRDSEESIIPTVHINTDLNWVIDAESLINWSDIKKGEKDISFKRMNDGTLKTFKVEIRCYF